MSLQNFPVSVILFPATACLSLLLTGLFRTLSLRWQVVDVPNERSSHAVPTPRLGGLAVVMASTAASLIVSWSVRPELDVPGLVALTAGALAMAGVGLVDDLKSLTPGQKLGGQLLAVLVSSGLLAAEWPGLPAWMAAVFVSCWIIGYTNLFNFMDGSDGLAGGVALINGLFLAAIAGFEGHGWLALQALSLSAAVAGFLRYNAAPAAIFMGDSGSLFLGYSFAVIGFLLARGGIDPLQVLITFSPFLFDGVFTLLRRLSRQEPVWRAHRSHLYQRLLAAGRAHRDVAWSYYLWAFGSGVLSMVYGTATPAQRLLLIGAAGSFGLAMLFRVWRAEQQAVTARTLSSVF